MPKKFKNKYRIKSTRLQNWDYGWNGAYFITICTQNRKHFFGEIKNCVLQLSEIGKMAEKYWHEIVEHFPFVELDAFVVMPNHIHGIIIINKQNDDNITNNANNPTDIGGAANDGDNILDIGGVANVKTQNFASLQSSQSQQSPSQSLAKNKFGAQSKNLASIIRGYKIGVTKNAKKINPLWQWQPRFHDHIIRNDNEYYRIKNYIINNPENWKEDKFNIL